MICSNIILNGKRKTIPLPPPILTHGRAFCSVHSFAVRFVPTEMSLLVVETIPVNCRPSRMANDERKMADRKRGLDAWFAIAEIIIFVCLFVRTFVCLYEVYSIAIDRDTRVNNTRTGMPNRKANTKSANA